MTTALPLRPAAGDDADDAAVARLGAEFPRYPAAVVSAVVASCRRDLDGSPPGAMPELVERLARQRLRTTG
ncbi:three-helix bundle dimerization domain-containing protein [Actinomycetospora flava]|uniref:Uncharacterized protein n=1 Tax=Actinomycetospora flava TaxID=3129232 RepID=A0ABU8MBM5_9PSEU